MSKILNQLSREKHLHTADNDQQQLDLFMETSSTPPPAETPQTTGDVPPRTNPPRARSKPAAPPPMPPALPGENDSPAPGAMDALRAQLEAREEEWARQTEQLQAEYRTAQAELERLRDALDAEKEMTTALQRELEEYQQQGTAQRAGTQRRDAAAGADTEALLAAQGRCRELEARLVALEAERDAARQEPAAQAAHDQLQADWQKQLDRLQAELDAARRGGEEGAAAREALAAAEARCAALEERLRTMTAEHSRTVAAGAAERDRLAHQSDAAQKEAQARIDALRIGQRQWEERAQQLENQAQEQTAALEASQHALEAERNNRAEHAARATERERKLTEQLNSAHALEHQLAEELQRRPDIPFSLPAMAAGLVLLLLLASGVAFLIGQHHRAEYAPIGAASASSAAQPSQDSSAASLLRDLPPEPVVHTPSRPSAPTVAPAKPAPGAPAIAPALLALPKIQINGLQVKPADRASILVFNDGVFTKRTEMSENARQILKQVGTQTRTLLLGGRCRLEIEGHTDPASVASAAGIADNKDLGLKRAQTVKDFLVKEGLPASALTVSSTGEANPPYPNTTPENKRKNRTVVLKLTLP